MNLADYIRDVPDFPKPGILFKDITPLLLSPAAFEASVDRMAEHYASRRVDAFAAPESRGFLFAAPLALRLRKPLVVMRKPGKLPYQTSCVKYDLEYGSAELHMHVDSVTHGAKVVMVDDVLATGGTMAAGIELIRLAGGDVDSCAFLMELAALGGRQRLAPCEVFSLLSY